MYSFFMTWRWYMELFWQLFLFRGKWDNSKYMYMHACFYRNLRSCLIFFENCQSALDLINHITYFQKVPDLSFSEVEIVHRLHYQWSLMYCSDPTGTWSTANQSWPRGRQRIGGHPSQTPGPHHYPGSHHCL